MSAFFLRSSRITLWDSVGLYICSGNRQRHNSKVTIEESLLKWRSGARLDEHNVVDGDNSGVVRLTSNWERIKLIRL